MLAPLRGECVWLAGGVFWSIWVVLAGVTWVGLEKVGTSISVCVLVSSQKGDFLPLSDRGSVFELVARRVRMIGGRGFLMDLGGPGRGWVVKT